MPENTSGRGRMVVGPDDVLRCNAMIVPEERAPIVSAIAALPDEAFGFLAGVLDNIAHTAGGFRKDSSEALMAIAPLVRTYFASRQGK